ncbi:hypothetical protein [Alkalicoccus luteus]|nr:hypothetical protein [Alkalicoccus luteus]
MSGHIPISPLAPKKTKRRSPKFFAALLTAAAFAGGIYYAGW